MTAGSRSASMLRSRVVMLLAFLLLVSARPAAACPMCQEAVPNASSAEEEDQARLARAYNNSILLMVGVPYLLVGAVGFLIYRQARLKGALDPTSPARPLSPGQTLSQIPGDLPCPHASPDEAS